MSSQTLLSPYLQAFSPLYLCQHLLDLKLMSRAQREILLLLYKADSAAPTQLLSVQAETISIVALSDVDSLCVEDVSVVQTDYLSSDDSRWGGRGDLL